MDLSSLDLDAVTVNQPRTPVANLPVALDWAQDTDSVKLFLPLVGNLHGLRGRDLHVKILPEQMQVTRRGVDGRVLLAGKLGGRCDPSESEWEVTGKELLITLRKTLQREWIQPVHLEDVPAKEAPREADDGQHIGSGPKVASHTLPRHVHPSGSAADLASQSANTPSRQIDASRTPVVAAGNGDASATGSLGRAYRDWDRFDEMGALAAVENEGLDPEQPGWSLRSSSGVASVQCESYVKDKEEIALDEELAEKRQSLQRTFNERAQQAADLKERGNKLLRAGCMEEALAAYLEGEGCLDVITEHASLLLSARLKELATTLRRDLQNNAAQAALTLQEWDEAIRAATAVLAFEAAQPKALYRRASAFIGRAQTGDDELARADLRALLRVQPQNGAARKLLNGLPQVV